MGDVAASAGGESESPAGRRRGARHGRPAGRGVRSRRAVVVLAVTGLVVVVLDVVTKLLAVARLTGRAPVELIPGVLDLRLTRNPGAAFSLAGGATVALSLVAFVVMFVILRTARRLVSTGWAVVLGALVGGAVGNLVDRIFRAPGPLRGHVVDWIHLHNWPVFNIADSAIVCGGVLAVILSLRGIGLDGGKAGQHPDQSGGADGRTAGEDSAGAGGAPESSAPESSAPESSAPGSGAPESVAPGDGSGGARSAGNHSRAGGAAVADGADRADTGGVGVSGVDVGGVSGAGRDGRGGSAGRDRGGPAGGVVGVAPPRPGGQRGEAGWR